MVRESTRNPRIRRASRGWHEGDFDRLYAIGGNRAAVVAVLGDGSIAEVATAVKIAEVAKSKFGSIDALVNKVGMYFSKHFTDYTIDDPRSLVRAESSRMSRRSLQACFLGNTY